MIARASTTGTLATGPATEVFTAVLSDLLQDGAGAPRALRLFGSGRSGLRNLLDALELPPGSTVLLPAYTFAGVSSFLTGLGYRVVLCDVDRDRPVMTLGTLKAAWRPGTRCVLVTHLFGAVSRTDELVSWAHRRGAIVIEDCAHALGSLDEGVPTGRQGDGAFFSFDLLKPINTLGGGLALLNRSGRGLCTAGSGEVLPTARSVMRKVLVAVGEDRLFAGPWLVPLSGVLAHGATRQLVDRVDRRLRRRDSPVADGLSNLQALIGISQAHTLAQRLRRRRHMARRVLAALDLHDPQLEEAASTRGNAYFTVVRAAPGESPTSLRWALWEQGIDVGHGSDVADDLGSAIGQPLPEAARWHRRAFQLPSGSSYSDPQIDLLCRRLRRFRGRLVQNRRAG